MTERSPSHALAIAAFVLGIVSIVFSIAVVPVILGLVGLVLGFIYLRRHRTEPRGFAVSAIVLSGIGVVASVAFAALYYFLFSSVFSSIIRQGPNQAALNAWVGVEAPNFTVTTLDGRVLELSQLRGKRVVVDFWATWCGPCIKEVPDFNRLTQESSPDELVLVSISKESPDVIAPFVERHGMAYPVVSAEDEFPAPYSLVRAIPTKFFIDRNGVIQSVAIGAQGFGTLQLHALAADYTGEPRSAPGTPGSPAHDNAVEASSSEG